MSDGKTASAEAPKEDKNPLTKLISIGKDLVALLRDLALFILALLLLVFPTKFNTLLTSAGFEEGSLVGFKWKAKLLDSDAALKEARATITDLQTQLEKATQVLLKTQGKVNDSALEAEIAQITKQNKQVTESSTKVEVAVSNTIGANATLVEKAQETVGANTMWGVVFGGDTSLEQASHEVQVIAPKLGIPNAMIYLRQGSYRSVALAESRAQAEQVLLTAKKKRADAYLVSLSKWCPNSQERTGYRECVNP